MERKLTEIELAWLAGLFDGEGCLFFAIRKDYPTHRSIRCDLRVGMAHHATIDSVADLFVAISGNDDAVGVTTEKRKTERLRPLRNATVHGRRAVLDVLIALRPYLLTKKLEADLAIAYLEKSAGCTRYNATDLDRAMANAATDLRSGRGEARARELLLACQVIPSQAASGQLPLAIVETEGLETRKLSPNDNASHECPAPQPRLTVVEGEDIVRSQSESSGAA